MQVSNEDISEQKTSLTYKLRDFEANSSMLRTMLKTPQSKGITVDDFSEANDAKPARKLHEAKEDDFRERLLPQPAVTLAEDKIGSLESTINKLQVISLETTTLTMDWRTKSAFIDVLSFSG